MYQKLDNILSNGLVSKSLSTNHVLMQLSIFDYLNRKNDVVFGKTECDFLYKKKPEDDRMEPWAADVVLIYRENGRKICEVIEVETINISRFYKRIKNINAKAGRVEKIYDSNGFYRLSANVDEVRFSLAMSSDGLNIGEVHEYLNLFRRRFRGLNYDSEVKPYRIYLTEKNLYVSNDELKQNRYSSFLSFYKKISERGRNDMYHTFNLI